MKIQIHSQKMFQKIPMLQQLQRWYDERRAEVFLISFPKCGRTWLRLTIAKALERHFELKNATNLMELYALGEQHPDIPKIFITHDDDAFWKKPEELVRSKTKYKHAKVIFLVRDPRDVLVSSYFEKKKRSHIYPNKPPYQGELSDYINEAVGSFDTILEFYQIWAQNRQVPKDFLIIRYEDLHANPATELRKVMEFIGIAQIKDAAIAEAVEFASFDNMRKMEEKGGVGCYRLKPTDPRDLESYKTRRGKVGGFEDYLSLSEIEELTRRMNETLSPMYGYGN